MLLDRAAPLVVLGLLVGAGCSAGGTSALGAGAGGGGASSASHGEGVGVGGATSSGATSGIGGASPTSSSSGGASTVGSGGSTSGAGGAGGAQTDFVVAYVAGSATTGTLGTSSVTTLQSDAREVALLSNGDFVVVGDEQTDPGGDAGLHWEPSVYVASGADGSLLWKDVDSLLEHPRYVAGEADLVGVDAADHVYLAGSPGLQLAKLSRGGSRIWATPDPSNADAIHAYVHGVAGGAAGITASGGALTSAGSTVLLGHAVGDAASPGHWAIAVEVQADGSFGWMTNLLGVAPAIPVVFDTGTDVAAVMTDWRAADPQKGGLGIALTHIDASSGGMVSVAIPPPDGYPAAPSPTGADYVRNWQPKAAARLADGSFVVLADESFFDDVSLPPLLWRVSDTGQLLGHVELGDDDDARAVATTPEGFVLLGTSRATGRAIARRYDAALHPLGDDATMQALAGYAATFRGGASRDGATLLVGHFEPALPQSADTVAIFERTHLP
ncbi:MAG TPA: hypothetical protein VHB21_23765 [Minicystis sp.]|nr:hypothetical protein [Minicystis sp.]